VKFVEAFHRSGAFLAFVRADSVAGFEDAAVGSALPKAEPIADCPNGREAQAI
jgi:hypothetical protein